MITLYQFTFSHFCEKARWALDFKGIPYRRKVLIPGPHSATTKKLAASSSVPVIVDGERAIQDSTAIISYLDEKYPQSPLTPSDPEQATEALEWEEYLDAEIGVTLRLWVYYYLLPDRRATTKFLLEGAPWYGNALYALIYPKLKSTMQQLMNINADSAKDAKQRLEAAWQTLDTRLQKQRYLVGDRFSRADLTACALLSPFCNPPDIEIPEPVTALRGAHMNDRFFTWVAQTYDEHRSRRG
ncbi:MAG: glutathione S-transferase family protein [Gammaproteobacteria bacterium]|nr:glutathione S-transferase family protein [Gammaproteobacteria bacterium]